MVNQEVINGTFKQPTSFPMTVFGVTDGIPTPVLLQQVGPLDSMCYVRGTQSS
jgi:hypothetical protein